VDGQKGTDYRIQYSFKVNFSLSDAL